MTTTNIQLGFCQAISDREQLLNVAHRSHDYNDWDGGQVGGRPVWLHPAAVPYADSLTCVTCCDDDDVPLSFVCQIYAPLEGSQQHERQAFHRSLYVFCCPKCCSGSTGGPGGGGGGVRVLRAQLPLINPYIPAHPEDLDDCDGDGDARDDSDGEAADACRLEQVNWKGHLPESYADDRGGQRLCALCGLAVRNNQRCPLQNEYFCSRQHQREHKKYVFDRGGEQNLDEILFLHGRTTTTKSANSTTTTNGSNSELPPSIFPMTELVVEEEPERDDDDDNDAADVAMRPNGNDSSSDNDDDDDDSDEDLEQDDLNAMTMGCSSHQKSKTRTLRTASAASVCRDAVTAAFYRRLQDRPNVRDQCLRYCRWPDELLGGAPLWIQTSGQPPPNDGDGGGVVFPPPCSHCGAPRKFEFQIMPQMLHFLLQRRRRRQPGGEEEPSKTVESSTSAAGDGSSLSSPAYDGVKAAVRATEQWMEHAPPELVSPVLVDAKERAVRRIQEQVQAAGNCSSSVGAKSRSTGTSSSGELDWGVICVYTCTKSCGDLVHVRRRKPDGDDETNNDDDGGSGLGAYREEYAWRQPSL